MAGKSRAALAALALFLAACPRPSAEEAGEYSFEIQPDGTPRFTQVLRWNADPNVLSYEVTVQTAAGEEVSVTTLKQPVLTLHLPPGAYRYRIVLCNLLGKPELELPWKTITVLKAEIPTVADVTPTAWFLDDLKPEISIKGENLMPGAAITLESETSNAPPISGAELGREGTSVVRVAFPAREITVGRYTLVVTDPGGVSHKVPGALAVRYQRPVDVLISGAYAPWVALYDDWYTANWPGTFFPLGAAVRLSVYFLKRPFGYVGVGLDLGGRLMEGGIETAAIDSTIGMAGLSALYKYPFSRELAVTGRIGAGVVVRHHNFDYEGAAGTEISSLDPYASAGFTIQCFLLKNLFLEAGMDWMHVFANGFSEGGLSPYLLVGFLF